MSVVVPTIGRVDLLRGCLDSIAVCRPLPGEVVIVDQSGGDEIARLAAGYGGLDVRPVAAEPRGVAAARNTGLRAARNEIVLMTDDDCTVAPDWVGVGARRVEADRHLIASGRVLPGNDDGAIVSTITDTEPKDYSGTVQYTVLFTGNVALHRTAVLEFGGFDEALETAEDNDLCYRWSSAGRTLVYEPGMVVWHHDWRSPEQLKRRYAAYWRGQGALYAKHLRARDPRMLRYLGRDLYYGARALARVARGRALEPADWRRGMWPGLPVGMARDFARRRKRARTR